MADLSPKYARELAARLQPLGAETCKDAAAILRTYASLRERLSGLKLDTDRDYEVIRTAITAAEEDAKHE